MQQNHQFFTEIEDLKTQKIHQNSFSSSPPKNVKSMDDSNQYKIIEKADNCEKEIKYLKLTLSQTTKNLK